MTLIARKLGAVIAAVLMVTSVVAVGGVGAVTPTDTAEGIAAGADGGESEASPNLGAQQYSSDDESGNESDADDDEPDDQNESETETVTAETDQTTAEDDETDPVDSDDSTEHPSDNPDADPATDEPSGAVTTDSITTDSVATFSDLSGVDIGFVVAHSERNTTSLDDFRADLAQRGASIHYVDTALSSSVLNEYDVLVFDERGDGSQWTTSEVDALEQWVNNGGSVIIHAESHPSPLLDFANRFGIDTGSSGASGTTTSIATHPTTEGIGTVYVDAPTISLTISDSTVAETLVWDPGGTPTIAVAESNGRVVFMGDDYLWDSIYLSEDNRPLANQIVGWTAGPSGAYERVLSDPNESGITVDIKNVSTHADESTRYFKLQFHDGWNNSETDGLNAAVYLDVDQSNTTGANVSNHFQSLDSQSQWNHLGADYAISVGAEGNALWKWNDTTGSWNKSYGSLAFLNLENDSTSFEVGVSRALIDYPRTFSIQTSNVDVNNSGEIDWARDQGSGVVVLNFTRHRQTSNASFPTVRTYLSVNTTAGLNGELTASNFSVEEDGVSQSVSSVTFVADNRTWVVEYNTTDPSRDGTVRDVSVTVDDPNGVDSTNGQYVAPTLEDALNVTDLNASSYPRVRVNLTVNTTAGRAGSLSANNFTVTEDGVEQPVEAVTYLNASESWILTYNTTNTAQDGSVRNVSVAVDDPAGVDTAEGQYVATGSVVISSIDPTEFPTVRAFVNVLSPAGRSGNLTADDFWVQEDGVNQTTGSVNFTGNATNTTIDILVVFDRTGSMDDEIADMRDGVRNMSRQLAASGRDVRFALVSFSDSDSTIHPSGENWAYRQNFTRNVTEFERELDALGTAGGTENNYDAVSGGLELSFRPSAQKVVIDITDEGNDFHEVTQSEVATEIETLGATYIAVTPDNEKRVLADEVDGRWHDITAVEFDDILTNITDTLSATWIVEYETTNTVEDGSVRDVAVTVDDPILRDNGSVEGRYIADTLDDDMQVERVENGTFPTVKAYLTINTSAGQKGTLDRSNFQVRENGVNQSIQSVNFDPVTSTWTIEYDTTRPEEDGGARTLEVRLNESAGVGTVVDGYLAPWACRNLQIDEPGVYALNRSITSARNDACVRINASDVVFDGRGHSITQTSGGEAVNITATGSVSNVTVYGLSVQGGANGITLHAPADGAAVTDVAVVNNDVNSAATGLYVRADGYASTVDVGIFDNRLTNVSNGLHVDASGDDGSVRVALADNRIDATGWGIDAIYADGQNTAARIDIINNTINTGSYDAIQDVWVDGLNQTVDVVIADNTIDAASYGLEDIEATGSDSEVTVTVLNNTIDSGSDAIQDIHAYSSDQSVDVVIAENEFNAGDDGIEDIDVDGLRSTVGLSIIDNQIVTNGEAIEDIDADASNQQVDVVIAENHLEAGREGVENVMVSGSGTRSTVAIVNNTIQVGSFDEAIMDVHAYGSDSIHDIVIADNDITAGEGIEDIEVYGTGTQANVTVVNNSIHAANYDGINELQADGSDSTVRAVIADNEITADDDGIDEIDIDGSNQTVEALIYNNRITGFSTYGINFDDVQVLDAHHLDVQVVANHIQSSGSSSVGLRIDPNLGTGPPSGALRVELNNISTGQSAVEVALGPVAGIEVHHNVLDAGVFGVENHNTTAGTSVNATANYWNASDGPGSADAYEDPVTGAPADGDGSNVTNATATVANVRFDPFLTAPPDLRLDSLADALTVTDVDAESFPTIRVTLQVDTSAGRNGTLTESNFALAEDASPQTIDALSFDATNETWTIEYRTNRTVADGTTRQVAVTVNESAGVGTVEATYEAPDTDKRTSVSLNPVSSIVGIGGATTFDVVVENTTGGVGAHNTTIALANATVGNITDVALHGNASHGAVTFAADNSSVTVDAEGMDTDDTGSVTIASVTIEGVTNGTTEVLLSNVTLEDESGVDFNVTGIGSATLHSTDEEADLTVSPGSADFGTLPAGSNQTADFTVTNSGGAPLTINDTSIGGPDSSAFTITSSVPTRLEPGESATLSVRFDAAPPDGLRSAVLVVDPETENVPIVEVSLSGGVAAPDVTLTKDALSYHSVPVDGTAERRFAIGNDGNATLTVRTVEVEGADPGAFDVTLDGESAIAPGEGLDVVVSFTPGSVGEKTARVVIESDDPVDPVVNVSLSGQGRTAEINATPKTVGFGAVPTAEVETANVTLTNDGFATLGVTDASVVGPDADAFTVVAGASGSVVPGGSHTITVAFEPVSGGPKSASLSIESDDPNSPTTVSLAGTGTVPNISVTPATRDFDDVPTDSSATRTVTVSNDGNATLVAALPRVTGTDMNAFTVVNPGGTMRIAPGETRQVTVSFAPDATGDQNASLAIDSNDPDEPTVTVALAGTGTQSDISLRPSALAFEEVRVGQTEARQVTIENEGANSLTVTGIDLAGSGSFQITSGGNSTPTLGPGESHTVTVEFAPTETGDRTATVTVTSDDPQNPQVNVSLGGTGVLPDINVSTTTIEYDDTRVAGTQERIVTVSNEGNANLTVDSTDLVGAESGDFSVVRGGSFTLQPDEQRNVTVAFTPADSGSKAAALSIASNDPDEDPLTVSLDGTAVTPDVSVTPEALLYGDVNLGSTKTLSVTLSNDPNATASLPVEQVVVIGPDADSFDASTGSFSLGPNESREISVTFDPQSAGDNKTAALRILTGDPSIPQIDVWLTNSKTIVDVDRADPPKPGEQGVDVTVSNATANDTITANVSQPESRENDVGVDELELNTSVDADFTLNLTTDDESNANFTRTNVSTPLKFIRVNKSIDDANLSNVSFVFRVSKVAIDQVDRSPEDITLYRYNETTGVWHELNVTLIGEARTHFLYRAESPGFSEFASGAKEPDFDVAEASVTKVSAVQVGETISIITRITNAEDAADGTFTVKLLEDGSVVATTDVTIAAGGTRQVTFDRSFGQAGSYTIQVNGRHAGTVSVGDSGGSGGSGSSGGGGSSSSGSSSESPFSLEGATMSDSLIEAGESIEVSATIENSADEAKTFTARFLVNNVPVDQREIEIPANGEATVSFSRTFDEAGSYRLAINDVVLGNLTVKSVAGESATATPSNEPEFAIEGATLGTTTIEAGQSVDVSAIIENTGDESATFTATFTVNGVVVDRRDVTIPAGESVEVSFSRTFERAGSYELEVGGEPAGTLTVEAPSTPTASATETLTVTTEAPGPAPQLPGFGPGIALLAVLLFTLIAARRRGQP